MIDKIRRLVAIILIELVVLLPIAIVDALTISNTRVEDITQISAKVKWETSEPSEGSVNFGSTKNLGQKEASPNFVKDHSILLGDLSEDTTYYFEVVSKDGERIIDNNNGNLYTFATLPKIPLFVNSTIPVYYNKGYKINVAGKSIRYAKINMYVNNEVPRALYADNNGDFLFPNVNLNEGENIIRFTAESQGKKVEKEYNIIVDTIDPIVNISQIPNVVGSERIIINGSVSELADILFYVKSSAEDRIAPPKIINLKNTSIGANKVELSWDKIDIEDFGKYIIYRNNNPIAGISDIGYNDYVDVFVNSNKTYIYQVAAMDKSGNLGEKSDILTVRTLEKGVNDRPELPAVDIYKDIEGFQKTIKTDNAFSEEIELGRVDGFYKIRIEAVDKAENKFVYEKDVLLDTKDPEIDIVYPKSNAEIFENYADMVTIRGRTEPGARVYLYVLRTPFGVFNKTWDIYGFPEQIQQLGEAELRANCRLDIQGEEQCRTHSDYEAVGDANGYFEFENVDLTSMWAGAFRITQYPTGAPYYDFVRQRELKDFIESDLFFIAVDAAGRKGIGEISYEVVTCWTADLTWDVTPLIEYQSPTFLNAERLKEGTESIYFYLNFTYHGRGRDSKNTRINNLVVSNACGSGYLEENKRYNYSCEILRSCTEKLSPNGKTVYVACPLGRLEGIDKWTDGNWENFIDSVKDEMAFPFRLTLTYDEEFENNTIEHDKTFFRCVEIGYVVDAAYINPKDVLPDWLLYDFVDLLNKSISKLNDWVFKIQRILEWAAIGCMVSFFVKFVTQIYRRITCYYDRFFKMMQGTMQRIGGSKDGYEDECMQCLRDNEGGENGEAMKRYKSNKDFQDLISDTCLEKCYPTCSSAWKSEESLYQTYRWACDRFFGHATPSRWTESASDVELFQKLSQGSGCANDQSVRGRPLRAISCNAVEEKYRIKGTFGADDKCLEITSHTGDKRTETLYHIDGPFSEGESVYEISKMDTSAPSLTYDFVIKQNEDNYLAPMEQTCERICRGELTGEGVKVGLQTGKGKIELKNKGQVDSQRLEESEEGNYYMTYGCITPNQCTSYRSGDVKQLKIEDKDEYVDVKTAVPVGYTRDCFAPEYVSGDPDTRIECCCINSQAGAMPEYFQPGDIENKDGEFSNQGYEGMRWSYRYFKMEKEGGYKNKKFNPTRYIEGRDQMACFGQNHWLYDGFTAGGMGNLLIIDPMKQHISAFQCLAISQILNRLALLRNMMVALENCLLSIRTTGKADSGVCKEIFTQYICAFIWKIITWMRDGCLPFGKGIDFTKSENEVLEAVSVGMRGVWDSVSDSQEELASEYGNAKLNNLIGMGEEDVFRKVCLGAFGYDWEIDADSLLDVAYHTPYATLVQTVLPSREYLTFDPTNYQSKYEYRSSWLINPGCDLDNYEVYLACVTRSDMYNNDDIDCSKQSDPYGRNCDCLELGPDKAPTPLFYYQSRGRIKQNQLINVDSSQITDRIKTSPYRYDHLMFRLRVDRNIIKNKGDVSKCFPSGHEDGIFYFPIVDYSAREVAGCGIDITTGQFSCGQGASFFYEEGNAWFREIQVANSTTINILKPKGATYYAGDNPRIIAKVRYEKDARKQCLVARLLDKERVTVLGAPRPVELKKDEISGEEEIGIYNIDEGDVTGGGYGFTINYIEEGRELPAIAKLKYSIIKKATKEGVGGPLKFIGIDNNNKIDISEKSKDQYSYNGRVRMISECYRNGACEIEIEDMDAAIAVTQVDPTPDGYDFYVQYLGKPEQKATLEPRYYLHLDLRYPKTPNGNCEDVKGREYDEEQVIVANGITQRVEIPIYVLPGRSSVNKCSEDYSERSLVGNYNQCVCDGSKENCPQENKPQDSEDDFRYCYGKCRKYPKCLFNTPLNTPCVCDPNVRAAQYDCGGDSGNDAEFSGISRKDWYCFEQNNKPTCGPKSEFTTVPGDDTPLIVRLEVPDPNSDEPYYVEVGDTLNIRGVIEDDEPTGVEEYDVFAVWDTETGRKETKIDHDVNEGKSKSWGVRADWSIRSNELVGKDVLIKIRGIDRSVKTGSSEVESKMAKIKVSVRTG